MRKTTATMFLLLKYANQITDKVWWDIFQWRYQGLLKSKITTKGCKSTINDNWEALSR